MAAKKLLSVGAFLKAGGTGSYEDYTKAAKAGNMMAEDEDTYKAVFTKAKTAKAGDAEEPPAEAAPDEDDEDNEDDEGAEKAEISTVDLVKAVEAFDTIDEALAGSDNSRVSYLEQRLHAGTLSKAERVELGKLWSGEPLVKSAPVRKSITDRIREDNDTNAELINGNDFLKSLVEGVEATLDQQHTERANDSVATRQLIKSQGGLLREVAQVTVKLSDALSKSLKTIDRLNTRLDAVEKTPAQPRSVGNHDPRAIRERKGFAKSQDGDLTKSQAAQGIRALLVKADQQGDVAAIDRLVHAGALLEQGRPLSGNIVEAIRAEIVH
jgi:hypothetical protein